MDTVTNTFSTKTIEEVKSLLLKTRSDSEKKKEELRQMVGERYRDIIEAADTINCMKKSCSMTSQYITKIQQFHENNKSKRKSMAAQTKQMQEKQDFARYLKTASEIKVLTEIPEKIWLQVELGNMTTASLLYLKGSLITKNLQLGTGYSSPILKWFPMIGQQVHAFKNLRSAIVSKCRSRLSQFKITSARVADSVCSVLMLDKCSLESVLLALLDARKEMLGTVLQGDLGGSTVSTTALITESVDCLLRTVAHVHELFRDEKSGCYVTEVLRERLDETEDVKLEEEGLGSDRVQRVCRSWLSDCQEILASGLAKLLDFVTTTKDLSVIREAVTKMLVAQITDPKKEDDLFVDDDADDVSRWDSLCLGVFGRGVDVWKEILQGLFVRKVTQIVDGTFERLLRETESVTKMKDDDVTSDVDLNGHLWEEHGDDVTTEMAWKHWQARQKENNLLNMGGGLTLKSMGVTPKIKQACLRTNGAVLQLLDEVSAYCGAESSKASLQSPDEAKAVYEALRNASDNFSQLLLKSLSEQIEHLSSLTDQKSKVLTHSLFLNFFCKHFLKLCTGFQKCFFKTSDTLYNAKRNRYASRKKETTEEDESWEKKWTVVSQNFNSKASEFMEIWKNELLDDVTESFAAKVESSAEQFNFCRWCSTWEKVQVTEESEKGEAVESAIHIPLSSSLHVQTLFFEMNHKLQKFGGHSIGDAALERMCSDAFKRYKATYGAALSNIESSGVEVSQTWALQTLFDVKYIDKMMNRHSSGEDCSEVTDRLENHIDPFDLELFAPYLNRNVGKYAAQTCTMYGLLANKTQPLKSSTKSAHNVMPVVPDCGRFSILPIDAFSTQFTPSSKHSANYSDALQQLASAQSSSKSSSFVSKMGDAISSSWISMSSSFIED